MLPITYEYKIFRNNVYLGSLPPDTVLTPFGYSLDINNGSAPMTIEVAAKPTTARDAPDYLEAEDGSLLQMEDGSYIELESNEVLFGASGSNRLIANDNDIIVYEFSNDYPSGKKVFSGWITNWKLQHKAGKCVVNCISYGMDLNDDVVQTGATFTAQITQDSGTDHSDSFGFLGNQLAQTFIPASSFNISKISVYMYLLNPSYGSQVAQLDLYSGTPGSASTLLATSQVTLSDGTASYKDFLLTTPVSLTSGVQYYFKLSNATRTDVNGTIYVYDDYGNPYADGSYWGGTSSGSWSIGSGADLRFIIYSSDSTVVSPYSSVDPTAIFKSVIDDYGSRGGKVSYNGSSTDNTGLTVSYTFNFSRTLDAIKKALELAPADWYWVVDPASQTAYFKQFHTTADILLTFGQNIDDLELGVDSEQVRNVAYFSGGPTAGVNLFKKYTNPDSLSTVGRQRLETLSDNRVTVSATADAIANAFLDSVASEVYQTTVSLFRTTGIDITTILPGKTVGFSGSGSFVDSLVLNIVRMTRYPDRVDLTIGSRPPRATSILKEIQNNITDLQTIDNPSSPS